MGIQTLVSVLIAVFEMLIRDSNGLAEGVLGAFC